MGSWEGSYSRSFVSKPLLLAAVRRDIRERLRPKYKEYADEPNYLLGTCFTANHLFDFRKLARLFAVQIAPAQVMNPDARVAYFSPASIKNFGLP
jgi:hypothetical protein